MANTKERKVDTWTVIAALAGFLSGAGLMSQVEILELYSKDIYSFIVINDGTIAIYGRQMVMIMTAVVAYLFLIIILGSIAGFAIIKGTSVQIKLAGLIGLLLMVSFLSMSSFAINRGYNKIQEDIYDLRNQYAQEREKMIPIWIWD